MARRNQTYAIRLAVEGGGQVTRFYRAVSIGSDPSLPEAVSFTGEAASLRPYAPVHLRGSRNETGDLTLTWIRRTRYSGEWRDLLDVPLNEASEAFEVDVLDGARQVVRTVSSSTPSITYTAAEQTADFGAPQSAIDIAVPLLPCRGPDAAAQPGLPPDLGSAPALPYDLATPLARAQLRRHRIRPRHARGCALAF